ncbi:hypothetical protein BGX24_006532 [Mortierella sp. AD032]|nr:hypothetical protein BGX24_006532 [Mortierella sp. AD032]
MAGLVSSFQHLPQELQDMILLSMSKHDVAVCALVCQAWFDVFAPVILDAVEASSSSCASVAMAGTELHHEDSGGQEKGRMNVLTVLDAYQRITAWLLAQGETTTTITSQQHKNKNDSVVIAGTSSTSENMVPEPIVPKICQHAVEHLLRSNQGLQELRMSGWWKALYQSNEDDSCYYHDSGERNDVASTDPDTATTAPECSVDKRRPPYPLCKRSTLHLTNTFLVKERPLLSFLERCPIPSSSLSLSSLLSSSLSLSSCDSRGPPPLQVQLSRRATVSMKMCPTSVFAAIPGGLTRLVLEYVNSKNETSGMIAASWRTIGDCGTDCTCQQKQQQQHQQQRLGQTQQDQQAFLHLRRLHHTVLIIDKKAFLPFLRRFQNLHEIHLCLLEPMAAYSSNIAEALSTSCPLLQVGVFGGMQTNLSDMDLAYLIGASSRGWKTLATDTNCVFGKLSAEAVVRSHHAETLENFRVTTGELDFPSEMIQELLCSAPRLKRFEGRSWWRDWATMMHISAKDLVQEEWVCTELETFHCAITGIPRPDVKTRKNGRPLKGSLHEGESMEESFRVQRPVYQQLGRLTKLRELVLGYRSNDADESVGGFVTDEDRWWEQGITEALYYRDRGDKGDDDDDIDEEEEKEYDVRTGLLYDTMAMSLESGLELLTGLSELTWLSLEGTSHRVKDAERRWMKQQWPRMFLVEDSQDGVAVARDAFWAQFMINGYHSTESWDNNWPDVEWKNV